MRQARWPLLHFCWPTRCFGCGGWLGDRQHLGACLDCWSRLRPLVGPRCTGCGLPRPATTNLLGPAGARCARCHLRPPGSDGIRAAVVYDALARRFLLRAKLGGVPELLPALGRHLAPAIADWTRDRRDVAVIPVPSHPWMRLRRGFTPAREVARGLVAQHAGLVLRPGVLRLGWRHPLVAKRLPAGGRAARARRAFVVRRVPDERSALLVDDVMTSGATVEACCRALRAAGLREIRVAVWARALLGPV